MLGEDSQPRRRSIRLSGYDYASAGAYFVTICTANKQCHFGVIAGDRMALNEYGRVAEDEWIRSVELRPGIDLDAFVIMPNHIHGIVVLGDAISTTRGEVASGDRTSPLRSGSAARSLPALIAGYKAAVTKRIWALQGRTHGPVWQRNYYEHVVRNQDDLSRIREYIENNPRQWALDSENPFRSHP
jgi:putative transposase